VYGWYSDNSVFLEDPGVYLRPGVYSVVVLEESPCPRGSSRTNFQVLVLESQVLDNNTAKKCLLVTIVWPIAADVVSCFCDHSSCYCCH